MEPEPELEPAPAGQECAICLEDFADPVALFALGCAHGHAFCYSCLGTDIRIKVEEGGRPRCPCCPVARPYLLSPDEVSTIIGAKKGGLEASADVAQFAGVMQRMEKVLLRQGLASIKGAVPCPGVDCENWLVPDGPRECCVCDGCGMEFCSSCHKLWHPHVDCTTGAWARVEQDWLRWQAGGRDEFLEKAAETDAKFKADYEKMLGTTEESRLEASERMRRLTADEEWKAEHCRVCPNCDRIVEKMDGCDTMVCGRNAHGDEAGHNHALNQQDGCGLNFGFRGAAKYKANLTHPHLLVMPEVLQPHPSLTCDACKGELHGVRIHCVHCQSFNLCVKCEANGAAKKHPAEHVFEIKFCAQDVKDADAADRLMAEDANLLGTGGAGPGAAHVAMNAAIMALNSLSKNDVVEVKAFAKPPAMVKSVLDIVWMLMNRKTKPGTWKDCRNVISDPRFLHNCVNFDKDAVPWKVVRAARKLFTRGGITPERVRSVSCACAGLSVWANAILTYCLAKRELDLAEQEDSTSSFAKDSFAASLGGLNQRLAAKKQATIADENPQLAVKMAKRQEALDQVQIEQAAEAETKRMAEQMQWGGDGNGEFAAVRTRPHLGKDHPKRAQKAAQNQAKRAKAYVATGSALSTLKATLVAKRQELAEKRKLLAALRGQPEMPPEP